MDACNARVFRIITILAIVPTLAFAIPYSAIVGTLFPALCIVPLTISACVGVAHVMGKAKSRAGNVAMDVFCAVCLLSFLIPACVFISGERGYWRFTTRGVTMLGAYATVPVMVNFMIHMMFILCEVNWRHIFPLKTCPHCNCALDRSSRQSHPGYQHVAAEETGATGEGKESTSSVRFTDAEQGRPSMSDDARPSVDDETVRLL